MRAPSRRGCGTADAPAFFAVSGVLVLASTAIGLVRANAAALSSSGSVSTAVIAGILGALWLASGVLLWRRRKSGAVLALVSVVAEAVRWSAQEVLTLTDVLFLFAILVLLAISWRALESPNTQLP